MSDIPDVAPFRTGELLRATRLEELRRAGKKTARDLANRDLAGFPDVDWDARVVYEFIAKTKDDPCPPPEGEPTGDPYTDPRYYLDRMMSVTGLAEDDQLDFEAEDIPGLEECMTATNLAEILTDSHLIPDGSFVHVFGFPLRDTPGLTMFFFCERPALTRMALLVQDGGTNGAYPTTAVTYTYTANDIETGQELGTGLTPKQRIILNVSTTVATVGQVYWDGAAWQIFSTDEKPAETPCPSPTPTPTPP